MTLYLSNGTSYFTETTITKDHATKRYCESHNVSFASSRRQRRSPNRHPNRHLNNRCSYFNDV